MKIFIRFFSGGRELTSTSAEETPSDLDVVEKLRARRRLALLPPRLTSSGTRLSLSASQDTVQESPSHDEVIAEPLSQGRKRLHFPTEEKSVHVRLQEFGYSKAKRAKHSIDPCPFSLLDEATAPKSVEGSTATAAEESQTLVKNPFAKTLMNESVVAPCASVGSGGVGHKDFVEDGGSKDPDITTSQSAACGTDVPQCDALGDVQTLPDLSSTDTCTQTLTEPRRHLPFMTSVDYITTHPALQQQPSTSLPSLSSTNSSSQRPSLTTQKVL